MTPDDVPRRPGLLIIHDDVVLEGAARILRQRSRKPNSIMLGTVCRVLRTAAARIRDGENRTA